MTGYCVPECANVGRFIFFGVGGVFLLFSHMALLLLLLFTRIFLEMFLFLQYFCESLNQPRACLERMCPSVFTQLCCVFIRASQRSLEENSVRRSSAQPIDRANG